MAIFVRICCFFSFVLGVAPILSAAGTLTEMDIHRLEAGEIISRAWTNPDDPRKATSVFGGVDINAPASTIWKIMLDCDQAVALAKDIKSCEVLSRSEDGLSDIRRQKIRVSTFLPKAKTVFKSEYIPDQLIRISRVEGDLKIQEGYWKLVPLPDDQIRVLYFARLKPDFPVPRRIFRRGVQKDVPEILENLRATAEAQSKGRNISEARAAND